MASITVTNTKSILQEFLTKIENCQVYQVIPSSLYFNPKDIRLSRTKYYNNFPLFLYNLRLFIFLYFNAACSINDGSTLSYRTKLPIKYIVDA